MKTVDARGLSCPQPVLLTKKALDSNCQLPLTVLVDEQVACENVSTLAKNSGFKVSKKNESDYIVLTIE